MDLSQLKQFITEHAEEFHLEPEPDLDHLEDYFLTDYGFAAGKDGFVEYLYVYPKWRGRGLTRELLHKARERWGKEKLLSLRCHPDLVELYELLGFRLEEGPKSEWGGFVEMTEVE